MMNRLPVFILILLCSFQIKAQKISYKELALKKNSNFFEIVDATRKQFLNQKNLYKRTLSKKEEKERKQFERWVWIWKDRVNPDGTFPEKNIEKTQYIDLLLNKSKRKSQVSSSGKAWQQLGPTVNVEQNGYTAYPGMGRINVVAVQTDNTNIMYAGSAAGGLWKTLDGGLSWSPKSDDLAGLGVTDIIIDPNNSNILYMATGDEDALHISSIGLFKSIDAGDTWTATGLTFSLTTNEYIRDISFAPGSSSIIFALTNAEIKKSTDSGASWSNVSTYPNYTNEKFQNIVFDPNDSNKVVVSDYWESLWYSSDAGSSFSIHPVLRGASVSKLKLTSSNNDNDNFYGISQDGKFKKFRFDNNNTADDLISEITLSGFNSQGGYNQCIAVSPTDKNSIIIGAVRGYKSTDNGANFSVYLNPYDDPLGVGFYVHPDHHHLSFLPDGVTVINGHDGGIHKGLISASSWTDISDGLIITQSYNIAINQGINGDDYMMANQDNDGFSKVFQGGSQKWVACLSGDGTSTGIDISNPNTRYLGGTFGRLYRSDNGYATAYNSMTILLSNDYDAAFVSPLALHPKIAQTIYAGHSDIKKSVDRGKNWTALNSGLTRTAFLDVSLYNNSADTRIFALGISGGDIILKRSINDGVSWSTIEKPESESINSVYGVPNTDVVYVTVSSYTAGKKVYKSTDNGANWTNISDNLPNIIMKKIILDPNKTNETIYLGTELGMYFTDNSTTSWTKLGTGLPNVIISDIKVSKNNGNVYIGTFGRGMWVYNDQKYFDNVTDTNWSVTANWEGETLPTVTDDVFIKGTENLTLNTDAAVVKSLEMEDGALLTIENSGGLTVENNFTSTSTDGVIQINSDASDSGVLIVKGNSTGKLIYVRGGMIDRNWSIVSSPVIGQKVKDFAEDTNNDIRINTTPNPNRYAIAKYNDENAVNSKWEYFDVNVNADLDFDLGNGYSMSRDSDGSITFTGSIQTSSLNVNTTDDNWVGLGNPFTAYYPANKRWSGDFIKDNRMKLDASAQALYVWNNVQAKYVAYSDLPSSTQKVLTPGQGFFIKMKAHYKDEIVRFNHRNLGTKTSLIGNHTFNKNSNTTPYVIVFVSKGNIKVNTDIIFSENATLGFDEGKDIINFNQSQFDLTTKLLDNQTDKEYTIQSIPKDDYENQIIPLNLKGKKNDKITFSSLLHELPEGIKMYLEDKKSATYNELSEKENYTLSLDEDTNGFDRFSIHFSRQALSIEDNSLSKIKIFNHNNLLQVKGIDAKTYKIDLFDIGGKKVYSNKIQSLNPIDLNGFSKGVYLVKVISDNKIVTKKIILN